MTGNKEDVTLARLADERYPDPSVRLRRSERLAAFLAGVTVTLIVGLVLFKIWEYRLAPPPPLPPSFANVQGILLPALTAILGYLFGKHSAVP